MGLCVNDVPLYTNLIENWKYNPARYHVRICGGQNCYCHQTPNISRTLVSDKIVDHSDVVGTSPVGAAPTTSSFSTKHLASIDWTKTTARRDEKHLSFGIWCALYLRFDGTLSVTTWCVIILLYKHFLYHEEWIDDISKLWGLRYGDNKSDIYMLITVDHNDVIKWKHFPRYWPFVRGIHRSPANSPHKGQWRGALMFTWICARINGWVNNRETGDLRRHHAHYDVIVMDDDHGGLHEASVFQGLWPLLLTWFHLNPNMDK